MISLPMWSHQVRHDGGRTVVILAGEVDIACADVLRDLLTRQIQISGAVDVDVAAVTFIDLRAIRSLLNASQVATAYQCGFTVVNANDVVRRTLEITGYLDSLVARDV
jgi:anti-sigma B factor antagonist